MDTVDHRLAAIAADIARATSGSGRVPKDVELIAVSKTHPPEVIVPLLNAGHRSFGENRVQEAAAKWPTLKRDFSDVRLHLIGRLQSNKAREAVALFDVIHSVDRPSLIAALSAAMVTTGERRECYIQVNIGDEPQKGGVALDDLGHLLAIARAADLPVVGLMAIPPDSIEPAPFFALLAKRAREHGLHGLSMGMSRDYETAVRLGATCVRIGSALFGSREPLADAA